MKKYAFKGLGLVLAVALIVGCFAGCAKINYVTDGAIQAINEVKDGSWKTKGQEDAGTSEADYDKPVIEEFKAGTYGGVEFKDVAAVAEYYKQAYDYTKTLTAQYKDDKGQTQTYYKMLCEEDLDVHDIAIDGSVNKTINGMVPSILKPIYNPGLNGLVPSTNRDPKLDTDEWDGKGESLQTSRLVADDLVTANVKDNGDGTITLQMQPKYVNMSAPGKDAQGHMFQSLGAIDSTVDSIKPLTWSEGTTADNCKVNYYGGTATVTIDTKTKEITKADYVMEAHVVVSHACIAVIRDKNATVDVTMKWSAPASEKYMQESKGVTRAYTPVPILQKAKEFRTPGCGIFCFRGGINIGRSSRRVDWDKFTADLCCFDGGYPV